MSWLFLIIAGILEVGWATGLKYTEGFTRPLASVLTISCMAVSIMLLAMSMKTLPAGTAYAVWTGIGTVGTVLLAIWLFGETAGVVRLGCIAMIVVGIAGLKLTS